MGSQCAWGGVTIVQISDFADYITANGAWEGLVRTDSLSPAFARHHDRL